MLRHPNGNGVGGLGRYDREQGLIRMPELPEAETIVRGLREHVVGRMIQRVGVPRTDVLREPAIRFATKLRGQRIERVSRRGKKVILQLHGGRFLVVNLGMTGRLLTFAESPAPSDRPSHPAVCFGFRSGGVLVFDDTRRFGSLECLTGPEWSERSAKLGPEPLDAGYSARDLLAGLARSRSPIRSWLLDQRRIAGIGNIYANEALYLAGVHPRRCACDVDAREARALHRAIRRVLRDAIRAGGTTIRDYRTASGGRGAYAGRLRVYGRAGDSCGRCGSTLERVVFGKRSAFYCPACQTGPTAKP